LYRRGAFQRCEFDKKFSKYSRLIISENAPWKGSMTKVFWYQIYCTREDSYQGENQWSLGTCQTFSQCYKLTRHENIYVVKKKLNQIHIPKLWEHIGLTFMKINTSKSMWLRTRWFYFIVVDKFWNLIAPTSWWFSTWGKELWVGMVHHSFSCDGSWVSFITQFHFMLWHLKMQYFNSKLMDLHNW